MSRVYTASSDSLWFDSAVERKKRANLCVRAGCDSPPSEGHVTCAPCRAKIQANRLRLRAQRAAQERRQTAVLVAALDARKTRVVVDGGNHFESIWDGHESLYKVIEERNAARRSIAR